MSMTILPGVIMSRGSIEMMDHVDDKKGVNQFVQVKV
jgi:hypothetical protein